MEDPNQQLTQESQLAHSTHRSHAFILGISAIVLVGLGVLGGYLLWGTKLQTPPQNSTKQAIVPSDKPTEPPILTDNSKQHLSKYFTVSYPNTWYVWSFGRGFDLEYFQINSVAESQLPHDTMAFINFDIQGLDYTESKSIQDQKTLLESYPKDREELQYTISGGILDGEKTLVYERTIDNNPRYEKTIWLVRNNIKYIISFSVIAKTPQERDALKNQYLEDYSRIISSLKFT